MRQLQMLRNWFDSHMREDPLWPVLPCFIIVSGTFLSENQTVSHVLRRHTHFFGKPTDSSLPRSNSDIYMDIFPAIVQVPPTFSIQCQRQGLLLLPPENEGE